MSGLMYHRCSSARCLGQTQNACTFLFSYLFVVVVVGSRMRCTARFSSNSCNIPGYLTRPFTETFEPKGVKSTRLRRSSRLSNPTPNLSAAPQQKRYAAPLAHHWCKRLFNTLLAREATSHAGWNTNCITAVGGMLVPGASQSGVRAWARKVTRHAESLGLMHPVLCMRRVLKVAKGTPSKKLRE